MEIPLFLKNLSHSVQATYLMHGESKNIVSQVSPAQVE